VIVVADACVVAGELVRLRGQRILRAPSLTLVMADDAVHEAERRLAVRRQELKRRRELIADQVDALIDAALGAMRSGVQLVPRSIYAHLENLSRLRVPADGDDWPTVAVALLLEGAIWTEDKDFFGCGCPVWRTETLLAEVVRLDAESGDQGPPESVKSRPDDESRFLWAAVINQVIVEAQVRGTEDIPTAFPTVTADDVDAANREERISTLRLLARSENPTQRHQASLELGWLLVQQGSTTEGIAFLQNCAAFAPDPYAAHAALRILCSEQQHDPLMFARSAQPLLARLPDTDELRRSLAVVAGTVFFLDDDHEAVISVLDNLPNAHPSQHVRMMLGCSHHALGNIEVAAAHYASVLEDGRVGLFAAFGLAATQHAQGNTTAAKATLVKASMTHEADAPMVACMLEIIAGADGNRDAMRRLDEMTNSPHEGARRMAREAIRLATRSN